MKIKIQLKLIIALFTAFIFSLFIQRQVYGQPGSKGITLSFRNGILKLEVLDKNTVHVRFAPGHRFSDRASLIVNKHWTPPAVQVVEKNNVMSINTGAFLVLINKPTGAITYQRLNGTVLLAERGSRELKAVNVLGEACYEIKQNFKLTDHEALYGLGQPESDAMNWRNKSCDLIQKNKNIAIPFLVSTNNWGILWDNYAHTRFEDNSSGMSLWSEVADEINYYFFYGKNPDQVVAGYRNASGEVPLLPKWAYGYWQSKERYKSRKELFDIAGEYRKRQIPIDNIIQDWEYWGKTGQNKQ